MQNTSVFRKQTDWRKSIAIVAILTLLLLLAIAWIFHRNVSVIDHKLEDIRTYESK